MTTFRPALFCLAFAAAACSTPTPAGRDEGPHEHAQLFELSAEGLDSKLTSPIVEIDPGTLRIGLLWDAPDTGAVAIRFLREGTWSAWEAPTLVFSEDGAFAGHVGVNGATAFQWSATSAEALPTYFHAEGMMAIGEPAAPLSLEVQPPSTAQARQTLAPFPNIGSRASWGARAPKCVSSTSPYRVAVHHTVTPTPDTKAAEVRLREIQSFHMDSRGYCDIAYNFLVSQDGRVWTGRGATVLGGHTMSQNTGNVGVSYIGTFSTVAPTMPARCNGAGLLAWLHTNYPAVALNSGDIKGHRDWPGQSTECPGNAFHPLLGDLIGKAINGCGPPNAPPRGAFDTANCTTVAGWAQDPDAPNAAIQAHLYFGGPAGSGAPGMALVADQHRADLCTAINSCKHGFSRRPPLSLLDGKAREVHMYAIDSAGGTNPLVGKRTLHCAFTLPAGIKRHVTSQTVMSAWKFSSSFDVAPTTDAILAARTTGLTWPATPKMIRGVGTAHVWLVDQGFRRHVTSQTVAANWRLDLSKVEERPAAEVLAMPLGPSLRALPVLAKGAAAHVYVIDDAFPPPDAGPGPEEPDGGSFETDGGTLIEEELDAGEVPPEEDGGVPGGESEGETTIPAQVSGGCGCQTADAALLWLLALGAAFLRRRRATTASGGA